MFFKYLFLSLISVMAMQVKSFRFGKVPRLISKLFLTTSMSNGYVQADRFSLNIETSTSHSFKGDVLIVPFFKPKVEKKDDTVALTNALKDAIPKSLSPVVIAAISEILDEGNFKADISSKQVTRVFGGGDAKYIAIVGMGPDKGKGIGQDIEVSVAYKLGKSAGSISKELKSKTAGLILPSSMGNAGLSQFFMGFHDTVYSDKRFRSEDKSQKPFDSTTLSLLGCSESVAKDAALTLTLSKKIVSGVEFAKDLVMAPPNSKTPVAIAEEAKKIAQENGLQFTLLAEKECKALGMGGYLGVQQGSMFPPQFIHMTYKPDIPDAEGVLKVALIGKGLTFDSGGYNLKAGAGSMIEMMKFDMGGCAAVLGCAKAIGALKPKHVEVHWISAVCENMISAEAMRPGDVLVASNGKTIEVANTDAEGRLTLADALVYADKLGVDVIIDLATLTGACMVGLGDRLAGLYSPNLELRNEIERAAHRTEEGIWPLPLEAGYKDMIKSHIADLKNVGGKSGGSITAALFLQEFVEKAKWAHIDMAGPVWDNKESKPTGYGVKLLVDYLLNARKSKSD